MITLEKCLCGRYNRYGVAVLPSELCSEERIMLVDAIRRGECVIRSWVCPLCKKEAESEDK